jgi:hypothetical protein
METSDKIFYSRIFKNINNMANIIIIFLILQCLYNGLIVYVYGSTFVAITFGINLFLIPAIHHIKQISHFYQYYLENGKTIYDN